MARILAILALAAAASAHLVQRGGGWGETCTPVTSTETCYETETDYITTTCYETDTDYITTTCYETDTEYITTTCYETDYVTTTEYKWSPPKTVYVTSTCYETTTYTAPCTTTGWAKTTGW